MKKIVLMSAVLLFLAYSPCRAVELEGAVYLEGVSQYISRGQVLEGEFSLQPGVSLSLYGFTVELWGSSDMDLPDDLFDELDLYLYYEFNLIYLDMINVKLGYNPYCCKPYGYPFISPTGQETIVELDCDLAAQVYVKWFHQISAGSYDYMEAGVSYEYPFGRLIAGELAAGAELSAGVNFFDPVTDETTLETTAQTRPTAAALRLYLNYTLGDLTVRPGFYAQAGLSGNYGNHNVVSLMVNYDWSYSDEAGPDNQPASPEQAGQ